MRRWVRNILGLIAVGMLLRVVWPQAWIVNLPLRLFGIGAPALTTDALRQRLHLPQGFEISLYDKKSEGARMLRLTSVGDLLVSHPQAGNIVLLHRDADGDGHPDSRQILLHDLDLPHGLDLADGWLYVGESSAVGRIRFDAATRAVSGNYQRLIKLPVHGQHWTRSVRVGRDGWVYVSVGSSCNACIEADPHRAALLRFEPGSGRTEVVATGLRNTVGLDWQPGTGDLYGTDNGRDLLGDDLPPCELNKLVHGQDYGWPYAYGNRVLDPEFGPGHQDKVNASVAPAYRFGAHNAPLGLTFLRSVHWPEVYKNAALVALHGSWNRSRKDGYKVVSLHFEPSGSIEARDFITGFERDEAVSGRPVDIAEDPAGALYVSDDYTGSIYRVTRTP
jgi:glucose/arabinose dehydrogenase